MVYLITYDLNKNKNYAKMYEAIKSCSIDFWHFLDSVWIIKSNLSLEIVQGTINASKDGDDWFVVTPVTREIMGWLPQSEWDKITHLFN